MSLATIIECDPQATASIERFVERTQANGTQEVAYQQALVGLQAGDDYLTSGELRQADVAYSLAVRYAANISDEKTRQDVFTYALLKTPYNEMTTRQFNDVTPFDENKEIGDEANIRNLNDKRMVAMRLERVRNEYFRVSNVRQYLKVGDKLVTIFPTHNNLKYRERVVGQVEKLMNQVEENQPEIAQLYLQVGNRVLDVLYDSELDLDQANLFSVAIAIQVMRQNVSSPLARYSLPRDVEKHNLTTF